ncbi:hypothetical protein GCM10023085_31300 [Actinomadura viridis]|uniref:Uncharacterized protein n=1 Tax=Actinomadura viridis TaxID=58110 RepID=A0A931DCZ0_9ACTN|nr:hypothetical protein [Actinomadura viridis]
MTEPRGGPRLAEGAFVVDGAFLIGETMREDDLFHRYVTTEDLIVSLPDRTHAAAPDLVNQSVTVGEQPLPGGLIWHIRDHIDFC